MAKQRLDDSLINQGLAANRDVAKRMIMAGEILVNDVPIDKAGTLITNDAAIRIRRKNVAFASRAGLKLQAALDHFKFSAKGRTTLDLGASTGGFTDCLLQDGAKRVYAIDVGTNQLIYRLRTDPRVVCLERLHAKHINRDLILDPIEALTVDVSFTSLRYVLPFALPLLTQNAWIVSLFKPQFELGRQWVEQGGIVRDQAAIQLELEAFEKWLTGQGLTLQGKPYPCPIKGREGNQEILLAMRLM